MSRRSESELAAAIAAFAVLWFWLSSLAFFPVPWPDDSAFYLVAVEWFQWPPVYRMHSQAPFVPTYDQANFNTMPGLPFLLGLSRLIGVDTVHGIRFYGYALLAGWAFLLFVWARRRGVPRPWSWLIFLAALTSPVVKWGAGLVRPEIWMGFIGVLILMDLDGAFRKSSRWRIPLLLALGAYIHFEAIMWVPAVAIGVFPFALRGTARERLTEWWRRLLGVGWRTALLLGPWILYVLAHFDLFVTQMETQFGRLQGIENPWTRDLYGLFHSIFLSFGSPVGFPKFLNPAKFVIWGALLIAAGRCIGLAFSTGARRHSGARLGAVAALGYTLYLWITHPEMWFITLIHVALWPVVVLAFRTPSEAADAPPASVPARAVRLMRGAGAFLLALTVFLQAAVLVRSWWQTRDLYTQENYDRWIDCIERFVADRQIVWLPSYPDALVDLAARDPARDYYRHNDFPGTEHLAEALGKRVDALVLTHELFHDDPKARRFHEGAPTEDDLKKLHESREGRYTGATDPARWTTRTCQSGPFWALVSVRSTGGRAASAESPSAR